MRTPDPAARRTFVLAVHDDTYERFHTVVTHDPATVAFFFDVAAQGATLFAFELVGGALERVRCTEAGLREADRLHHAALARRAEWSAAIHLELNEHADQVATHGRSVARGGVAVLDQEAA